jgi:RES domain-containing protein
MRLWRISNYGDLSGTGGLHVSARWHSKGKLIVYAAESSAGALCEALVHMDIDSLPDTYQLITIDIDRRVAAPFVELSALPADWTNNQAATRTIGDEWLTRGSSLLLRVPSAIVPDTWNMLVNPAHPDASRMRIVNTKGSTRPPIGQALILKRIAHQDGILALRRS